MFEELKCEKCGELFDGRKPLSGVYILCPKCLSEKELPLVNEGDPIPDSVYEETANGRGME